jgi:hypothetical protein
MFHVGHGHANYRHARSAGHRRLRPLPQRGEPGGRRESVLGRTALGAGDERVGRQFQLLDPRPGNRMPDRPANQVSGRCPAQIPGLVHNSRRVLTRIDRLTAFLASLDLVSHTVHAGAKLLLVVERRHHHMPSLPSLRVIAVVANDEALDAVVLGVYSRHSPRLTRSYSIHYLQDPLAWVLLLWMAWRDVHAVLVTLAVVAVLAVLGAAVMMLWHSHRAAPYDSAWQGEDADEYTLSAAALPAPDVDLAARVAELEHQLAERRAIEAPQQHVHIHGVSAEDVAVALARHNQQQLAIKEN